MGTRHSKTMCSRFIGSLVGAIVGDCIGADFECRPFVDTLHLSNFLTSMAGKTGRGNKVSYTDDTAMTRSVADSLISKKAFNASDMAMRFAEEYFQNPGRGYGANVVQVFQDLHVDRYADVYQSAREQFGGTGSYGNGGGMRIAPVALFAMNDTEKLIQIARDSTLITHTNKKGYNGAILQCLAVQQALTHQHAPSVRLSREKFVEDLQEKMKKIEGKLDDANKATKASEEEAKVKDVKTQGDPSSKDFFYVEYLQKVKTLISYGDVPRIKIKHVLVGIAAHRSIPTAIYCFLRCMEPVEDLRNIDHGNALARTVLYAISLGGDTDTIASMAGSIAGAYYGIESVPSMWQDRCEGVECATSQAKELYHLATGDTCTCH
ncbi:PREDICTED: poly(ADP-ribose) glycohydrolase ARH3-like isoform X2 [Priapulus caudatus]|uniref:ADP-ribosylhydrolase ARH3 n=1 Tax=Priapulus caudatus TaxID=37621 RepID=A0ABM1EYG6_PRICU|nr:PREDICTED: poly(ADP-ribose) glycohydrolase ARH3-like isoform X2 [Priapulus caudatus]